MTGSGVIRRHIVAELLYDHVTRVTSGLRLLGTQLRQACDTVQQKETPDARHDRHDRAARRSDPA
jgi:hypothetical protein